MLWTVNVEGGPRRVNHAAVGLEEKQLVFTFGGYFTGDEYNHIEKMDVHIFSAATLQWFKLKTPTRGDSDYRFVPYMRYGHTAALISNMVYIFGGRSDANGACNTLHCFDTDTLKWSVPLTNGSPPEERDGHSACVVGTKMYIFGGFKEEEERFGSDLHFLETKTMTWYHPWRETPNIWRDFHTATAIGNKIYIFGGRGDHLGPIHSYEEKYDSTIYEFDTERLKWSIVAVTGNAPSGRRSHSAIAYRGKMYIFGGYNGKSNKHFSDMWSFHPETSCWCKIDIKGNAPCARRRQSLSLIGDKAVLFGGTCPISSEFNSPSRPADDDDELGNLQDLSDVYILDFFPSLKTLSKRAVLTHNIECAGLPSDLRAELDSMKPDNPYCRITSGMTQG